LKARQSAQQTVKRLSVFGLEPPLRLNVAEHTDERRVAKQVWPAAGDRK